MLAIITSNKIRQITKALLWKEHCVWEKKKKKGLALTSSSVTHLLVETLMYP